MEKDKARIYFNEFQGYSDITMEQQKKLGKVQYYDLSLLPTKNLHNEIEPFIRERCSRIGIVTMQNERYHFENICRLLNTRKWTVNTLREKNEAEWIEQLKAWMLQNNLRLIIKTVGKTGNEIHNENELILYFRKMIRYVESEYIQSEKEKDIWVLKKLDISIRENSTRNFEKFNFSKIIQEPLRDEVKEAIYYHLQIKAVQSVSHELSVMRRFSKYLNEKYPQVKSGRDIDRAIWEEYLINLQTEKGTPRSNGAIVQQTGELLECIGKIYSYVELEHIFLKTDIPMKPKVEFRAYSDNEIKRLNAGIAKMDIQYARAMVIHQMLGNRISDTLTLRRDCLWKIGNQNIITIHQTKTRTFQKPISEELAQLIQKAIEDSRKQNADSVYIFMNASNPSRPLQYETIRSRVLDMIRTENLVDDNGQLFGFRSHMYRHYFGVKLTEMHVDDWTISKMLGHKGIRSVKFYRKMSNQRLADETRPGREYISEIMKQCLWGWEDEYEQIRQNG